ncbi:MAG: hypothetical protein AB1411_02605 [Nitrospirota bacterium]
MGMINMWRHAENRELLKMVVTSFMTGVIVGIAAMCLLLYLAKHKQDHKRRTMLVWDERGAVTASTQTAPVMEVSHE